MERFSPIEILSALAYAGAMGKKELSIHNIASKVICIIYVRECFMPSVFFPPFPTQVPTDEYVTLGFCRAFLFFLLKTNKKNESD